VLEGSVQRDGDQIRVTAQLIDAASNAHLWSERWDEPSKEIFTVQNEIADQLGNRLGGAGVVDKAEREAGRRSRPEYLTAYELYLAGRSEALRVTSDGNNNAIELFQRAVAADPGLARAWADLHRNPGLERRRSEAAERNHAGRGLSRLRLGRDIDEEPEIDPPARMRVEVNLARCFSRWAEVCPCDPTDRNPSILLKTYCPPHLRGVLSRSAADQFASTYPASEVCSRPRWRCARPGPHKLFGVVRRFQHQAS
jgi:hypothetical protein